MFSGAPVPAEGGAGETSQRYREIQVEHGGAW